MKILVATDGTLASESAVEKLLRLPLPRVAEIIVLTVVQSRESLDRELELNAEPFPMMTEVCDGMNGGGEDPDLTYAEDLLRDTARCLRPKARFVRTVLEVGKPAEEILRVAEAMEVDLIMMGNKGRTGIDRWLIGSVSEKVLQQAKCPVLIVKS